VEQLLARDAYTTHGAARYAFRQGRQLSVNRHRSQSRGDGDPAASDARIGELFLVTLQSTYSAEMQIIRAIWNIGAQSQSEKLRETLQKHVHECPPSAPVRQIEGFRERRNSGSS
jgi:hypothetical protein